MRDLRRKLLLLGNHFFERLKTANFSTACGTVTLKSPLSRAFSVPDVHPRPRKHFSRCTLDCGFKTSESPALRGFVGGLRALATAALYLVLKSNGLHRSKNLPVKFGFSPKTVPANIAKKLPPQCCSKPLLIPFSTSRTNGPRLPSLRKRVYTLGFRRKIAHSGSHAETGGLPLCRHSMALCCQQNRHRKNSRRKRMHVCGVRPLFSGVAALLGYSVSYPSTFESVTPLYNVSQIRFRH